MLIDSHCHLDLPEFQERTAQVLEAMSQHQIGAALCIAVNLEDFPRVLALAESHSNLLASVGVHPEVTEGADPDEATLVRLADHPRVVAIGETGLDYYWHKDRPEWQRQRFRRHIRAAKACGKPLVIHTREAAEDTLRILEEEDGGAVGGIMHCFSEDWAVGQRALDLGFYLSFSGIVTFKNAATVKDVATRVPLDRFLVETDSPYLAPTPYRGKVNQPAWVRYVAEEVARLKGLAVEDIEAASCANFFRLFPSAKALLQGGTATTRG